MPQTEFQPDWASAPGDTIADILAERKLSIVEFARRIGRTQEQADRLLTGHAPITRAVAEELAQALGASSAFWMARESQYRLDEARLRRRAPRPQWLREIPLRQMVQFGWLAPFARADGDEAACLRFFDVPDSGAWRQAYGAVLEQAVFRKSTRFRSEPGAVAAWLRQGELETESIRCGPWDRSRFRELLPSLREFTREKNPTTFVPKLQRSCAECGVAVAVVRAPRGCPASGATRFLSPGKALLLLSFRYLTDDHFWFTFFHESGHLLLHASTALFLEGPNRVSTEQEEEANEFAANTVVPQEYRLDLASVPLDGREILRLARRVRVSPGVVVGQLQHMGRLRRDQLNGLKRRFRWTTG